MASQAELLRDAYAAGVSLSVALYGVAWNSWLFLGTRRQDGHVVYMA